MQDTEKDRTIDSRNRCIALWATMSVEWRSELWHLTDLKNTHQKYYKPYESRQEYTDQDPSYRHQLGHTHTATDEPRINMTSVIITRIITNIQKYIKSAS